MVPEQEIKDELPPAIAGSIGGLFSAVGGQPLDTLKTRVQAGRTSHLFTGLFAGLLSPVVVIVPQYASLYWGYKTGCTWMPDKGYWTAVVGGVAAGVMTSFLYCPVQSVKCTAQIKSMSSLEALKLVYRSGGIRRGLYRGYLPTLAYCVPAYAAFFPAYEALRDHLPYRESFLQPMLAGGLAGMVEATVGMFGDTVRVRYQTDLTVQSPQACAMQLWRKEGIGGFFRGYPYAIGRGIVAVSLAFGSIEASHFYYRTWQRS